MISSAIPFSGYTQVERFRLWHHLLREEGFLPLDFRFRFRAYSTKHIIRSIVLLSQRFQLVQWICRFFHFCFLTFLSWLFPILISCFDVLLFKCWFRKDKKNMESRMKLIACMHAHGLRSRIEKPLQVSKCEK